MPFHAVPCPLIRGRSGTRLPRCAARFHVKQAGSDAGGEAVGDRTWKTSSLAALHERPLWLPAESGVGGGAGPPRFGDIGASTGVRPAVAAEVVGATSRGGRRVANLRPARRHPEAAERPALGWSGALSKSVVDHGASFHVKRGRTGWLTPARPLQSSSGRPRALTPRSRGEAPSDAGRAADRKRHSARTPRSTEAKAPLVRRVRGSTTVGGAGGLRAGAARSVTRRPPGPMRVAPCREAMSGGRKRRLNGEGRELSVSAPVSSAVAGVRRRAGCCRGRRVRRSCLSVTKAQPLPSDGRHAVTSGGSSRAPVRVRVQPKG